MMVTPVGATEPRNMPVNGAAVTTSAPSIGNSIYKDSLSCTYQVNSAAAATVIIQGSNDNINWLPAIGGVAANSTITLSAAGSGVVMDTFPTAWRFVRANVTAATAATNVLMGV